MTDIHLNAQNLDLLRRIDADQNGAITTTEAANAIEDGLLDDPSATSLSESDRTALHQRATQAASPIQLVYETHRGSAVWTEGAPQLSAAQAQQHGLPATLMQTGQATVRHGSDPGDYFCEHVFYAAQYAAILDPGQSVAANVQGERLVGFLHIPGDDATAKPPRELDQTSRHAATRQVVGAALRGYVDAALPQAGTGPVRLLVTGFGPFEEIRNNPTGDFVRHTSNLNAAMQSAFGDRLLTPQGEILPGATPDQTTIRFRLRDAGSPHGREVLIQARYLQAADSSFQHIGNASVQSAVREFQPHAMLSLGVNPDAAPGEYLAENHADNAGMTEGHHSDSQQASVSLPANYSLARAIVAGSQPHP